MSTTTVRQITVASTGARTYRVTVGDEVDEAHVENGVIYFSDAFFGALTRIEKEVVRLVVLRTIEAGE